MNRELPDGHMARYRHHREMNVREHATPENVNKLVASPKGGSTEAFVYNADKQLVAWGQAHCRPDEPYNKRLGRTVALGRALHDLEQGTPPPAFLSEVQS